MPEQGKEQLDDFLFEAKELEARRDTVAQCENQMLATGLAMQGAGILPPNFDLQTMVDQAGIQITLEGLLKGH